MSKGYGLRQRSQGHGRPRSRDGGRRALVQQQFGGRGRKPTVWGRRSETTVQDRGEGQRSWEEVQGRRSRNSGCRDNGLGWRSEGSSQDRCERQCLVQQSQDNGLGTTVLRPRSGTKVRDNGRGKRSRCRRASVNEQRSETEVARQRLWTVAAGTAVQGRRSQSLG